MLNLREQGHSYAAIARTLDLKRANDARNAFLRALRKQEGVELAASVARERQRLDVLEARIRDRDAAEPDKLERRLAALEAMRAGLQ